MRPKIERLIGSTEETSAAIPYATFLFAISGENTRLPNGFIHLLIDFV